MAGHSLCNNHQVGMNFGQWFVDGNIFMKSGVTIAARYGHLRGKFSVRL